MSKPRSLALIATLLLLTPLAVIAPPATAASASIVGSWVYQSGTLFGSADAGAGGVTVTVSAVTIGGAPGFVGTWSHLASACTDYAWNASGFSSADASTWPPWLITSASGDRYAGKSWTSVGAGTVNGASSCWPEWFLSSTWSVNGTSLTQTVTCPASDPTTCGAGYSRTGVWVRPTSSSAVTAAAMRATWTDIYTPVRRAHEAYVACKGDCTRKATALWHKTGWARTRASAETTQWPDEVRAPVVATFVHWNKAARAAVRYETSTGAARTRWYNVLVKETNLVNTYLQRAWTALNAAS